MKKIQTLKSRILLGAKSQAVVQFVQILIRFSEVPIYLYFWGEQKYGEWLMLAGIPMYLVFCDFGLTNTACKEIVIKAKKDQKNDAIAIFHSALYCILIVLLCLFVIILILYNYFNISKSLKLLTICNLDAYVSIFLLTLDVFFSFAANLLNSSFWVDGKYYVSMRIFALSNMSEFLGGVLFLYSCGTVVSVSFGMCLGRLFGLLLMLYFHAQSCSWLSIGISKKNYKLFKEIIPASFATLIFPVTSSLNVYGLRLVIGLCLSPKYVSMFMPIRTLSNFAGMPRMISSQIVQPELATAFGENNVKLFNSIVVKSFKISLLGSITFASFLFMAGYKFVPFWTAGRIYVETSTYIFLLIAVIINSIWYSLMMGVYATNRHKILSVYYLIICGVLAIILSLVFVESLGLSGVALSLMISESLMCIVAIPKILKMMNMQFKEIFR